VIVQLAAPVAVVPYAENRALGALILFDPVTGETVAGGVVGGVEPMGA